MKGNRIRTMAVTGILGGLMLLRCAAHSNYDHRYVSNKLTERAGAGLGPEVRSDIVALPDAVDLSDGLSESEAVAVALWNNAQFQSDCQALGFARADVMDAGYLRNPTFSMLFPIGPKQLEFALNLPVEFIWQRPYRVAAAKRNAEKIAESLVQNGLALVRDVRFSFAQLNLAKQKAGIIREEADLDSEIARIAAARLRAGDISRLEETAFRLLASQSQENAIRFSRDAAQEEIRLGQLLGFGTEKPEILIRPSSPQPIHRLSPDSLIRRALASRPDLRAAEISIEAAGKKLGWERSKILNLTAVLDANGAGKEGFEMGPGLQAELPLFNWNNTGRKRAQTELKQAAMNYLAVEHKIVAEVLQAARDCSAAWEIWDLLRQDIVPSAGSATRMAQKAYDVGEVSNLEFLNARQQLLRARLRETEAEAEMRRSIARLEFSLGCRLGSTE